jgi:hypothetical protein
MVFNFNLPTDPERHQCNAHKEGDWIIFTCSKCDGYQRKLNFQTGEMKNRPGEDPFILHEGYFQPVGFEVEVSTAN